MEISADFQEREGLFVCVWQWITGLFQKLKTKVISAAKTTKKTGEDDPRRITHSVKMGLALSLISLFYYFRPIYDSFGVSTMWAVLTVVVVFEFTVGATLGKGFNRGVATCLAGALGVGAHHLASLAGQQGEPVVLGFFVFLLAAAASYSRFVPQIKARYDYGVLIFILTFSLVSVSGYRVEKIIELAHQRLSTILLGCSTCVFVAIFVCPVWAGEDLHNQISDNIEKIADFLEVFGGVYFKTECSSGEPKIDKLFLERYKTVLNSKAVEEALANFARWEPCHGRFMFRHPWKQYLKIGGLTRQCAYRVEALNTYINSDIQAPPEFKMTIQEACTKMSSESAKALSELASVIRTMTHSSSPNVHVANSKTAANNLRLTLKTALPIHTDLLQVVPAVTVTSLLVEIISCTEKLVESVNELALLAKFKIQEPVIVLESAKVHPVTVISLSDMNCHEVVITIDESLPSLVQSGALSKLQDRTVL